MVQAIFIIGCNDNTTHTLHDPTLARSSNGLMMCAPQPSARWPKVKENRGETRMLRPTTMLVRLIMNDLFYEQSFANDARVSAVLSIN